VLQLNQANIKLIIKKLKLPDIKATTKNIDSPDKMKVKKVVKKEVLN